MYSAPYNLVISLFSILAFLSFNYKKAEAKNYYVVFFIYLIFFGFRGYVGSDFFMYYELFHNLPEFDTNWSYKIIEGLELEKGFLLYMTFIKTLCSDYSFFVFINCLINITCILLFIRRYSSNVALSIIIFLEIGGLVFETDVLRNMKAMLIFLLSIKYIEQKRLLPYFLLNCIGFTFHSSSIIYFPMYWILNKPIGLKKFWLLFIVGNVVFLGQIHILSMMITPTLSLLGGRFALLQSNYLDTGILSDYGLTMGYFLRIAVAVLISFYYDSLIKLKPYNVIFLNALMIYLLLFCYFSEIRILAIRMTNLFFFSYAVIIPQIVSLLHIRNNQLIYIGLICIISMLKVRGKTNIPIYEYDSVLFEHKGPYERKMNVYDFYMKIE